MLQRMLYRSILRGCRRGKDVDCLPCNLFFDADKGFSKAARDSRRVLEAIRENAFERDAFEVLRTVEMLRHASNVLHIEDAEFPAFVLPSHTLLPSEHATFHVFEPRYIEMVHMVQSRLGTTSNKFVHLAARKESIRTDNTEPVGTIVTIKESQTLPDGRMILNVLAGQRIIVKEQRDQEMTDGSSALLHVKCESYDDDCVVKDTGTSVGDAATPPSGLHEELIAKLEETIVSSPKFRRAILLNTYAGMPSLLNYEKLTFWTCQTVLDPANVRDRLSVLYSQNTDERAEFALAEMDQVLKLRANFN